MKIISVASKHRKRFEDILSQLQPGIAFGAGQKLGGDLYSAVKRQLSSEGITHQEHDSTSTVPNDHTHN